MKPHCFGPKYRTRMSNVTRRSVLLTAYSEQPASWYWFLTAALHESSISSLNLPNDLHTRPISWLSTPFCLGCPLLGRHRRCAKLCYTAYPELTCICSIEFPRTVRSFSAKSPFVHWNSLHLSFQNSQCPSVPPIFGGARIGGKIFLTRLYVKSGPKRHWSAPGASARRRR